jgi:hypothetical protein
MATEGFAQALGRYLDQLLSVQAPVRKAMEQQTDAALKMLGLPSRAQVVGLAAQMVGLEERLEGLEDRLDELKALMVEGGGASAKARPSRPPARPPGRSKEGS